MAGYVLDEKDIVFVVTAVFVEKKVPKFFFIYKMC